MTERVDGADLLPRPPAGLSPWARGVWAELLRTQYETLQDLGWKPRLFRPPYELHNRATDGVVRSLGLVQVLWSATSGDDLRHPTRRSRPTWASGSRSCTTSSRRSRR